jgi:hypothetical protein
MAAVRWSVGRGIDQRGVNTLHLIIFFLLLSDNEGKELEKKCGVCGVRD